MDRLKLVAKQIGRVSHELLLSTFLMFMYVSGSYMTFAPTLQTIMLKSILVSLGFLHAHITSKLCFPKVNWDDVNDDKYKKILRIVLYFVFIYSYSHGG